MKCKTILNLKRYDSVKAYLSKTTPALDDEWVRWMSNYTDIIAELTNYKLSDIEILKVQAYLVDVLRGLKPEIATVGEKNDTGRLLTGLMNATEETCCLSLEEKRMFAYCIIISQYMDVKEEETGETFPGITRFTSTDNILSLFCNGYGSDFFGTFDKIPKYDKNSPLGYSIMNPIIAETSREASMYLKSLKSNRGKIAINKIGTFKGAYGEVLSKYEAEVTRKHIIRVTWKCYLYVNEFGLKTSLHAPDGFEF